MRQRASGFEDLRGADVSATVPVSERLLNEIVQEAMPPSAPVRDIHITPQAGDRFLVRARLGASPRLAAAPPRSASNTALKVSRFRSTCVGSSAGR